MAQGIYRTRRNRFQFKTASGLTVSVAGRTEAGALKKLPARIRKAVKK